MMPYPSFPRRLALAGGAAALWLLCGACSSFAPNPHYKLPAYRQSIALSGAIAVHYTQDGEAQHLSANYDWQQHGAVTDITLRSPVGTVAQIRVTPQLATLTQAGKPPHIAPDVDALTTAVLGWPLPVSGLREWLQGRATDEAGQPFAASPQRDRVTTADGWQLRYIWDEDGLARLDLSRAASGASAEVALRISIHENN